MCDAETDLGRAPNRAGNGTEQPPRMDPRVQQTKDVLGDALIALMTEKIFDRITLQEVLDRAGANRGALYAYFQDKQDLLLSDVEVFFEGMATFLVRSNAPVQRVAPVRELFRHVDEAGQLIAPYNTPARWIKYVNSERGCLPDRSKAVYSLQGAIYSSRNRGPFRMLLRALYSQCLIGE